MDWDELRYVLAIHRTGTLTGAATALGVTRTTVGRRLKQAEERLGARLFDRTPDGLSPTPAGDELVSTARRIECEVLTTEGRIQGRDAELRGRLRVTCLDFVFHRFPHVFTTFVARFPRVDLTVHAGAEIASLARREADVALRLTDAPDDTLVGRRVGRVHFAPYAARTLQEQVGADAPLSAYPWLHSDERNPNPWFDAWLATHAPGVSIALRSDDYGVTRTALVAGAGAYLLPCFDGDAIPDVVRIGPRLDVVRPLWVLTLAELRDNSRVRAFTDHAHQAFRAHHGDLEGAPSSD